MQNWDLKYNRIEKIFEFSGFKKAVKFINKIAEITERYNYYPDIKVFEYKKVLVVLTTPSIGRPTEKDYKIASKLDSLFK
jgi:pterin-4a-carbinolamine dehydratase